MGRVLTVPVQAATTKAVLIDRDCSLISCASTVSGANAAVLSTDPALTGAAILAAPGASVSITGDILCPIVPNSAAFAQNLNIPLSKGSTIFVNSTSATWIFLLFEDTFLAEIPVT